ncbi:unannotated protein [freshwater metagenome]|uniref:Unannotated protein n=1 Tax=freshwater metagenome TaxID=449393 RepID=A0A6J7GF01_9ZZZZ
MIIATTAVALASDEVLEAVHAESGRAGERTFHTLEYIEPDALTDSAGRRIVDLVLVRGVDVTAPLLSACDLAGIRIIGIVAQDDDARTLDRLRLFERLTVPMNHHEVMNMLAIASPGVWAIQVAGAEPVAGPVAKPVAEPIAEPTAHVARAAQLEPTSDVRGRVVTVWGAAGSPGVSTVALGLAAIGTSQGLRTLIIDANVYGGTIAGQLNLFDEAPGLASACRLAGRDALSLAELNRVAHHVARSGRSREVSLAVLTGITESERWTELSARHVTSVVELARSAFDVIFIDASFCLESDEEISSDLFVPRRHGATLACLAMADVVVGVTGCDSLSLSRYILALPRLREVIENTPLVTCVNRLRNSAAGIAPESSVRETLRRFAGISEIIGMPDDVSGVDAAVAAGRPVPWNSPRGRFATELTKLGHTVLNS